MILPSFTTAATSFAQHPLHTLGAVAHAVPRVARKFSQHSLLEGAGRLSDTHPLIAYVCASVLAWEGSLRHSNIANGKPLRTPSQIGDLAEGLIKKRHVNAFFFLALQAAYNPYRAHGITEDHFKSVLDLIAHAHAAMLEREDFASAHKFFCASLAQTLTVGSFNEKWAAAFADQKPNQMLRDGLNRGFISEKGNGAPPLSPHQLVPAFVRLANSISLSGHKEWRPILKEIGQLHGLEFDLRHGLESGIRQPVALVFCEDKIRRQDHLRVYTQYEGYGVGDFANHPEYRRALPQVWAMLNNDQWSNQCKPFIKEARDELKLLHIGIAALRPIPPIVPQFFSDYGLDL
jgi:hypothetical protein